MVVYLPTIAVRFRRLGAKRPVKLPPHSDLEESVCSYVSGGLCPIQIGSIIRDRYRIVHKLSYSRDVTPWSTSWVAQDEKSGSLVQLTIYDAQSSSIVANHRGAALFRSFIDSSEEHENKTFQGVFHEFWIESVNGEHYCRSSELGLVSVRQWMNEQQGLRSDEVKSVMSILVNGIAQLHRRGIIHGDISCENMIFMPTTSARLSVQKLLRFVGLPREIPIKSIVDLQCPRLCRGLPTHMVYSLKAQSLMELGHVARFEAFPYLLQSGDVQMRRTTHPSPESLYSLEARNGEADNVWAVGCVIYELITGTSLFAESCEPGVFLSQARDLLGDMPPYLMKQWRIKPSVSNTSRHPRHQRKPLRDELRTRVSALFSPTMDIRQAHPVFNEHEFELLVNLLEWILQYDPTKRPSMEEVVNHQWFLTAGIVI